MSLLRKSKPVLGRTECGAVKRQAREADRPAGVRMTGAMHLFLHTRLHDLHRANFTSKTQSFKYSYESSLWDYYGIIKMCKVKVRGGADKFLARPTSKYRRAESTVSLERGVCSCAELQVFSCYRGCKEACQAMRAISTTWRCEPS